MLVARWPGMSPLTCQPTQRAVQPHVIAVVGLHAGSGSRDRPPPEGAPGRAPSRWSTREPWTPRGSPGPRRRAIESCSWQTVSRPAPTTPGGTSACGSRTPSSWWREPGAACRRGATWSCQRPGGDRRCTPPPEAAWVAANGRGASPPRATCGSRSLGLPGPLAAPAPGARRSGAHAFAHIGVLRELEEALAVDRLAGASIGSAVAGDLPASCSTARGSRSAVSPSSVRRNPLDDWTFHPRADPWCPRARPWPASWRHGDRGHARASWRWSRQHRRRTDRICGAARYSTPASASSVHLRPDRRRPADGRRRAGQPAGGPAAQRDEGPVVAVNISMGGGFGMRVAARAIGRTTYHPGQDLAAHDDDRRRRGSRRGASTRCRGRPGRPRWASASWSSTRSTGWCSPAARPRGPCWPRARWTWAPRDEPDAKTHEPGRESAGQLAPEVVATRMAGRGMRY